MEAYRVRDNSLKHGVTAQILLDTSFLLTMLRQHRDIDGEIRELVPGRVEISLLDRVIFELERINRTKSSVTGALADASLELAKKRNFQILETWPGPTDVDTALIAFALARRETTMVATVDKQLGQALVVQGIPTIYPRRGKGLTLLTARPRSA